MKPLTSFADRMADFQVEPYQPTPADVSGLLRHDPDMELTARERELLEEAGER
jgi:hypothetical protein